VQTLGGLVQDHEVVACALHFGEANSHVLIIGHRDVADWSGLFDACTYARTLLSTNSNTYMRIPAWTPEQKHQPQDLVDAILARRGGELINLDRALLWSEPVARGWNVYLKNIRTGLPTSRKLCELGICTVALLTGAKYEYHHHAPDFLTAGGTQAELDALNRVVQGDPCQAVTDEALHDIERLVVQYAAQMTRNVKVDDALFAAMQARFTTTELVELTTAIATYNMVARFLVALQITPDGEAPR
jgi:alkylhydroperoxidase family enzyme